MFYVYLHKYLDGNIFYVGKATHKDRGKSRCGRSKAWKEASKNGFTVEYIAFEDELDAIEFEELLISEIPNLVNVKKSDYKLDYSSVDFDSLVYYDETSPTFLRYKVPNKAGNPASKRYAGDVAGNTRVVGGNKDYSHLKVNGNVYVVQRVVWKLFNGDVPQDMVINHIDLDKSNNKIENLELCTRSENSSRTGRQLGISNRSNIGISGAALVYCHKTKKPKIKVKIIINKKTYTKIFCVTRLGLDEAIRLAKVHLDHIKEYAKEN